MNYTIVNEIKLTTPRTSILLSVLIGGYKSLSVSTPMSRWRWWVRVRGYTCWLFMLMQLSVLSPPKCKQSALMWSRCNFDIVREFQVYLLFIQPYLPKNPLCVKISQHHHIHHPLPQLGSRGRRKQFPNQPGAIRGSQQGTAPTALSTAVSRYQPPQGHLSTLQMQNIYWVIWDNWPNYVYYIYCIVQFKQINIYDTSIFVYSFRC